MAKSNKFGFAPLEVDAPARRERSVGPMGAAVREAAESLTDATDAKVENVARMPRTPKPTALRRTRGGC